MNFEKHRREDGSYLLHDLFDDSFSLNEAKLFMTSKAKLAAAHAFLADLEALNPTTSREVAALAVATAKSLARAIG